ncbi:MAG: MFS transporter [Microthrixaceae bacterium]
MLRHQNFRSPLVVECMIYLAIAAPLGIYGAAWPVSQQQFDRDSGSLGLLVLAYGLGRLSTSATALPLLRRVNMRVANTGLCVLFVVADLVAAFGRNFFGLVACFAMIGLLTGSLDSLGARFQSLIRNVGSSGLMFGCYGLGAALGPAVSGLFSWTTGFVVAAGLALIAAILASNHRVDWPHGLLETRENAPGLVAKVPLWPLAISLVTVSLVCALEATTATWAATYLEDGRGAKALLSSLAVSGLWLGITLGRLLLGRVPWPSQKILVISGFSAAITVGLIPILPVNLACGAFVFLGVAIAGLFPTLVSTTATRVGTDAAGRVSGWQLLAANLAATSLAALLGLLVVISGAQIIIYVMISIALCSLVALVFCARIHVAEHSQNGELSITQPERAP